MRFVKSLKYKELFLLGFGLSLAFFLFKNQQFHFLLKHLGGIGYLGAFIAGTLFVWSFAAVAGVVILLVLAENLPRLQLALIAGMGAVLGDFIILYLIRKRVLSEIEPFYQELGKKYLKTVIASRYLNWTLAIIGAIIIASPLPDELGITLIGISKMKTYKFLLLSFVLNTIGIIIILSTLSVLKP